MLGVSAKIGASARSQRVKSGERFGERICRQQFAAH